MPLQLERNGDSRLLEELEKAKPPLLDPQNQRNQCLVILRAQRSVLKGVAVLQKTWAACRPEWAPHKGALMRLGDALGPREALLAPSALTQMRALHCPGEEPGRLHRFGMELKAPTTPQRKVSTAHRSVLPSFHAKG